MDHMSRVISKGAKSARGPHLVPCPESAAEYPPKHIKLAAVIPREQLCNMHHQRPPMITILHVLHELCVPRPSVAVVNFLRGTAFR